MRDERARDLSSCNGDDNDNDNERGTVLYCTILYCRFDIQARGG